MSPASSSTCAAAAALQPTLSQDAAPVTERTPLSPRSPATLARNKVLQQSRSQQPSVSTPIDVDVLEHELSSHPDRNFVNCLLNSLGFGTRIGYTGPHLPRVSCNLISASQHPEVVSRNIDKEVNLGRVVGPFSSPPLPLLQCHPIGVFPKNHTSEWRTIYHLSYPEGASINDFIPKDPYSLQYVRVDDAISILKCLGPGCFMAKTDLKSAFRLIPIHPDDWHLLGIYWKAQYFVDMYLPFGLRSTPYIFKQLSDPLE